MALSSLPDTLFTSRTANFGGTVIPEELSQQQGLASRATAYSGKRIKRIMIKIILINNLKIVISIVSFPLLSSGALQQQSLKKYTLIKLKKLCYPLKFTML